MSFSKEHSCSIFIVGDICISKPITEQFISEDLENTIKSHEIRIANWEAPIIDDRHEKSIKAGPHIFQDKTYASLLQKNIFNVYNLANNHSLDFGLKGLEKTIIELSKSAQITGANIDFEKIYEPIILNKNNIKIAIFACAEAQFGCAKYEDYGGGYAWIFSNILQQNILKIRSAVDFIIVLPHAGLEMENLPLPEWRECYKNLIDLGADMVVASHPHVIQPKELYKNKCIYYSLGNFLFNDINTDKRWNTSLGLSCILKINEKGHSIEFKEYFIENTNNFLSINKSYESFFNNLNNQIIDQSNYLTEINKGCLDAWNEYYERYYTYYELEFSSNYKWLPSILVKIINKLIRKYLTNIKHKNQVLLYHNIAIETHRFAVERALRMLNKIT